MAQGGERWVPACIQVEMGPKLQPKVFLLSLLHLSLSEMSLVHVLLSGLAAFIPVK